MNQKEEVENAKEKEKKEQPATSSTNFYFFARACQQNKRITQIPPDWSRQFIHLLGKYFSCICMRAYIRQPPPQKIMEGAKRQTQHTRKKEQRTNTRKIDDDGQSVNRPWKQKKAHQHSEFTKSSFRNTVKALQLESGQFLTAPALHNQLNCLWKLFQYFQILFYSLPLVNLISFVNYIVWLEKQLHIFKAM